MDISILNEPENRKIIRSIEEACRNYLMTYLVECDSMVHNCDELKDFVLLSFDIGSIKLNYNPNLEVNTYILYNKGKVKEINITIPLATLKREPIEVIEQICKNFPYIQSYKINN